MLCKASWAVLIAVLLCSSSTPVLAFSGPDSPAKAVVAAMKAASGGKHWEALAEIDQQGEIAQGGQTGPWRRCEDLRQGRYTTYATLGGVAGGEGYDGRHGWFMDEKSMVSVRDSIQAQREVTTDAYIARRGWLKASSADAAQMRFLGRRRDAGRNVDGVRITPRGGIPFELWIEEQHHFLDYLVKHTDDGETETIRYTDYRPVAGVLLPYVLRTGNGDAQYDSVVHIQKIVARRSMQEDCFQQPASSVHDAYIEGGAPSASVPFSSYGGLMMVRVSLAGAKPLPFILDTGGLNLLTPEAARTLGIDGKGHQAVQGVGAATQAMQMAQVPAYRIGKVVMEDQRFLIVKLPLLLTDRGKREPIAGLIGYELLRRFATRIDYVRDSLTFTPVGTFHGEAGAVSIPIVFDARTPQITARVDGVAGIFALDSGDSGDLTVFEPFAKAHGIRKLGKALTSKARGAGGTVALSEAYVGSLSIGPFTMTHPLTAFAAPAKGVFASHVLGGNIGYGVLSQFVLTFDYEHRRLYLQRGPRFGKIGRHGYSGVGLDRISHDALVVATLVPGSPGDKAGLRSGDHITAINDVPVSDLGLDAIRRAMQQPAGSRLSMKVLRGQRSRVCTVVLGDRPL